jgi:hypothetical protein
MKQIPSKMKPRLFIFALAIVLIYFISGFFASQISFFAPKNGLEKKEVSLNEDTTVESENQLMWWGFKDNNLTLNYNNFIINEIYLHVFGKKTDNSISQVNLSNTSPIGADFNGSFMASLEPIRIDMNGDNIKDEVNVAAKVDTIYTRGFTKVNTYFENTRFPFEVVLVGDYDLKVYFKNDLLKNAEIEVTFEDGSKKKFVTDPQTGMIHISNMNELRNNINILYSDNGNYYLLSYIVEGHRLLSAEHIRALTNLGIIVLISSIIIIFIITIKKLKNKTFTKGGIKIG